MKRLFALLLVAVLLLCCGCTDKSTPSDKTPEAQTPAAQTPDTVAPENAAPVLETRDPDYVASYPDPLDKLPKDEDGKPMTAVPASPADPELSNNPTGATNPVAPVRPSGGKVKVYTDDSKYTAFQLPQAKYTRLKEGPMTEFEPMQGLGAVYPYAAAPIFTKGGEGGWSGLGGYHWGLTDKNGRLLTDGVYHSVEPLEYVDYSREPLEITPLPYWEVSQITNVRTVTEGEGTEQWIYTDGDMLYGLIAKDGSFATPVKYRGIRAYPDCVIATVDWETPGSFDVYDLHGKLIFSGKDLPIYDDDSFSLEYGEGLFVADWYRYEDDEEHSVCRYIDLSGREVLGPYAGALPFSDGLACVSEDGRNYGYIDKTGAWVIEPRFETSASFRNGFAILGEYTSTFVIDKTGKEILHADPGFYLSETSFGYVAERFDSDSTQRYYDFSGRLLYETNGTGWWRQLKKDLIYRSDEDEVTILSVNDPEKTFTAHGSYAQPAYARRDGKPVSGVQIVDWENRRFKFVTDDLSESWDLSEAAPSAGMMEGYRESSDMFTGKLLKDTKDRGRRYMFDESDRLIGSCPSGATAAAVDGMLLTITDYACTYTDQSGKILFCYPLKTYLDD